MPAAPVVPPVPSVPSVPSNPNPSRQAIASAADALGELAREALRVADLARDALRASEIRYRRLFETAQDGILLINSDTAQIEDVNPYLLAMLGYTHEEMLGRKLWEVGPFADRAETKEMFTELQTKGYVRYEDLPLRTKAGETFEVEFVSNSYYAEGIKVIQCNIRNITDRKIAEARALKLSRRYAALSETNKAIVHCTSESELFPRVCRAAVEFGGLDMAWVGMIDAASGKVLPVASFGDDLGYLDGIDVSLDASVPEGHGPTGIALREARPYWCDDLAGDPADDPWRERREAAGWKAFAALPLSRSGAVVGAFNLYSRDSGAFAEGGRILPLELATDISFALGNFALDARRRQADAEIRGHVEQLKTAMLSTVEVATIISEMRDAYTAGHERRVAQIAVAIGAEMGLDANRQEGLRVAGSLHDVGKISIPSEILSKPGRLSALEFDLVKGHAQSGHDVLRLVKWPWPVAQVALQHHERMDGSGYPNGLKGDAILLESRIMAVSDVVEAMSSHRPYRPALGLGKALAEIERGRGGEYDATVADACLRIFRDKGYQLPI